MDKCFAMRDGRCQALKEPQICDGCVFHKTEKQKKDDDRKARKRCDLIGMPFGKEYLKIMKNK